MHFQIKKHFKKPAQSHSQTPLNHTLLSKIKLYSIKIIMKHLLSDFNCLLLFQKKGAKHSYEDSYPIWKLAAKMLPRG